MPNRDQKQLISETVGFTAILTSIFAVYIPHTYAGVPAYARISLLVIATNNLLKAITFWVSIPDGGLESVSKLDLGPGSHARTIAIAMRRREGQELFWLSCVFAYISFYAPQLTFTMLKFQMIRLAMFEVTNLIYNPLTFRGKSLLKTAPEDAEGISIEFLMVALPLIYAYFASDM